MPSTEFGLKQKTEAMSAEVALLEGRGTVGIAARAPDARSGHLCLRRQNPLRYVSLAQAYLGGGHRGGVTPILDDVDPLARLRMVRGRLAPQMEAAAQAVAERVIILVMDAVDLNVMLARIDLNAVLRRIDIEEPIDRIKINEVLDRIDLNALLAQVDLNAVLRRVDIEEPIDRVDLNGLLDRVDVNQIVQQVNVNEVIARIDLDAVLDRIDMNAMAQRIDVEALVEHTDLGAVIARSSSGIASSLFDAIRSRTIGVDEAIARWVARLRRRPYTGPPGPPGPPAGLPAAAGS
jgi:hypothetical protein